VKIYIAGPWVDRAQMPGVASLIEGLGHTITHKWWEHDDIAEGVKTAKILQEQATLDQEGVVNADMLILINSSKSEGKATEQGMALALGKPIVAVGKLGAVSTNVFHYLPSYRWVDNLEEMVKVLTTIQWIVNHAS
jgi:nucleoside 2-deoxyribosyltransferase